MPALDQNHLKRTWSWMTVQGDRDTRQTRLGEVVSGGGDKSELVCFYRQRMTQTSKLNPRFLFSLSLLVLCLYACIVDVAIMAFLQRITCGVHCSYMK